MKVNREKTPAFEAALEEARKDRKAPQPLCVGNPGPFMDYEGAPPSEEECRALCAPCPLLAICKKSASYQRPEHGVQGGIAWLGGKQFAWLLKLGHIDEQGNPIEKKSDYELA